MKAYKGFNKDMTCRDFKFEEGKTFETDKAELCNSGFHACEDPMDCLSYYPPASSVYHEVELDGVSDERQRDDSKVCAKRIRIGARLDIAGLVRASISYVMTKVKATTGDGAHSATTGYGAHSATTGDGAHSATTGYRAHSKVSGQHAIAAALGIESKACAALGCWIVLAEYVDKTDGWELLCVKAAKVDGDRIKPNTWYKLHDGNFVEVEDDE